MKYIKLIITTLILASLFSIGSASAAVPTTVSSFVGDACGALSSTVSSSGCSNKNGIKNIVREVVNVLSYFIGIIAVIMIIISGFRYILSAGDSNAVAAAKNTLIYALVGLAIAVLAQVLVHDVLTTTIRAQKGMINESAIRYDG